MAISVRDIQEKEFTTVSGVGYDMVQVDDFLDELAQQMAALVRENLELNQQIKGLESQVRDAQQAQADAEAKAPDYNEKGYFANLQNAMRESLIGAQRIADETLEEANTKAEKALADAQAQAEEMTATAREKADALVTKAQADADEMTTEAKGQVELLEARYEALKASAASFKQEFTRLLEQQSAALRESNGLF